MFAHNYVSNLDRPFLPSVLPSFPLPSFFPLTNSEQRTNSSQVFAVKFDPFLPRFVSFFGGSNFAASTTQYTTDLRTLFGR